jgi:hypothetical protein
MNEAPHQQQMGEPQVLPEVAYDYESLYYFLTEDMKTPKEAAVLVGIFGKDKINNLCWRSPAQSH